MTTLVTLLDIHISSSKLRRSLGSMRASFGDFTDFTQFQKVMEVGEEETYEFSRFFIAHFRDVTNVELFSDDGLTSVILPDMVGIFSLPKGGKVRLFVPSASTISLGRVVNVLFS